MAPLPSHLQALLPDASSLRLEHVEHVSNPILIVVSSAPESARCPICDTLSRRIHSRYERSIRDLPWHGRFVRIKLRCRRFYCQSPICSRKIFAERLPEVVKHYGRRTERFRETINIIGYALGGEAGARLAERIGLECSADAILRELKNITTEASRPGVRVLGVDDWAWRKGQSYGTILVDLERRRPIDLLPDRSARSFQRWLADHPGVEVITRDRAGLYAEGGKRGAPNALQVADRFHLVCNLSTAAERFLQQKRFPSFRPSVELPLGEGQSEVCRMVPPKTEPPWKAQRRQRRVDRYEEVRRLHQEGHSQKAISQLLGMGRKTIRRFIRAGEFPERKAARRPSRLDRFRNYLEQRWSEGCHNATQLWREIQEQGYKGCRGMVANLVTRVDGLGCVRVRTNFYSVPTAAGTTVEVRVHSSYIEIREEGRPIAWHERCYERQKQILELEHYLSTLERKPGALAGSKPLAVWREKGFWPASYDRLLAEMIGRHGKASGTRQMVQIIGLVKH